MKTSAAKSGRSAKIATRLVPPSSLPSCRSRAGTSRSAIPPSLTASSTAWFTMPTASRCAESPCGRNAIRRRTRRRNERKLTSLSTGWRFIANKPASFTQVLLAALLCLLLPDNLDQSRRNFRVHSAVSESFTRVIDDDGGLDVVPSVVSFDRWHLCKLLVCELLIGKTDTECPLGNRGKALNRALQLRHDGTALTVEVSHKITAPAATHRWRWKNHMPR